jgi:transglutaminase-like putative cysteine protease
MSAALSIALATLWVSNTATSGALDQNFDPWTQTARYEFEYRVDLTALPDGSEKRLWIPAPADAASQSLLSIEIESPWPHRVNTDAYGNRIIFVERSGELDAPDTSSELVARFVVERRPSSGVSAAAATARPGEPLDPARYLGAQRKIPLEGLIADIASNESRGLESDSEKIRAFYDYVIRNMTYAKHGEGWGNGDAVWACTSKYGNCTDFHSLFIGMARSQKIPARFLIGFPIPAGEVANEIPGYHCWAEVYQDDRGWFPIDASEAKKSSRIEAYFGKLPSDRIEFTVGRDLTLTPPQSGEPVNFFIYPYAEVDGERVEKVPASFRYIRFPTELASRNTEESLESTSAAAGRGGRRHGL